MAHAAGLRTCWEGDAADFLAMGRGLIASSLGLDALAPADALTRLEPVITELPGLKPDERAMLVYVARLTLWPGSMTADHLEPLRQAGFDDRGIHDIVHVTSCFAYMNRLADGTGVTLLPHEQEAARELFGDDSLEAHLEWGEMP